MSTPKFVNPSWRAIRILLLLALVFLLIAIPGLIFVAVKGIGPNANLSSAQTAFIVLGFVGASLTLGMFLSAILTISTARAADRVFADFLSGKPLAHWTYPQDLWLAFVESEKRQMKKGRLFLVWFMVGTFALIGVMFAWFSGLGWGGRILIFSIAEGSGILIALAILIGGKFYAARRTRRLLQSPEAFISKEGLYCGGDFNFWGSAMHGLQSVRLLEGPPPVIEVVIGLSKGAKKFARTADTINLLTLHPTVTSNYQKRYVIPVPTGAEQQAKEIVRELGGS